ncbi:14806_t:CDS:2, partial [Racocetra fulgida]
NVGKNKGDDDHGKDVIEKFIGIEVRRAVIYNIEYNEETLAHILQRARDIDPMNRRGVYMKLTEEINDFRVLSIEDREKLLSWEVTRLAFFIQRYNNFMNQASDEEQVNFAFIVGQLFLLAKLLDYGDEGNEVLVSLQECLKNENEEVQAIAVIFLPTLIELLKEYRYLDKNDNAVPPLQIVQQLVDWTNPFKVKRPLADSVARNALNKFESALLNYFDDAPDALDDEELEQLKDIFEFVDHLEGTINKFS